jgi:hypothetical protein
MTAAAWQKRDKLCLEQSHFGNFMFDLLRAGVAPFLITFRCRSWVDSVEKVLAAVGTKFLRAADAFNAV